MEKKHLSAIPNDVVQRCAQKLGTSFDALIEEFETLWKPEMNGYSRKLVEFCCSKVLNELCCNLEEKICDGSFSRFTFNMMLAWEMPSSSDEESYSECMAKKREDRKLPTRLPEEQDDIPLFYSDLMPLLVDEEPGVGEDAFVWLATSVPLAVDVVNGRFTFETLTAPTAYRLHFPGYDKFLKEINKCIKHLQKQATPKGVELADDEFILHVEGTVGSQRVVRHIGGTSWPGRLTLTNYALYFETSGVISYDDAIKIDLSKDIEQSVKPAATGPWGAPLFDKAIVYESSELQEPIVLEFPEVASSTRRDHWLALIKEVMLLHWFLKKFKVESPVEAWETHARTILGIIRLHATREMFRISPPDPNSFLIFTLFDELPKGDYVLQELAESLNKVNIRHPCSASSILRSLNVTRPCVPCIDPKEIVEASECVTAQPDNLSSLEGAINQVREEAKEVAIAKATVEGLQAEGIEDSVIILLELLKLLKSVLIWFQEVLTWQRPVTTLTVLCVTEIVIYKEWVGKAIAAPLLWMVAKMLWARQNRIGNEQTKVVVRTTSDKTTIESIVSAQYGLKTLHDMIQTANITILKLWSIFVSRAPKHADMVMMGLTGLAILVVAVPFKFFLMALVLYCFMVTSKVRKHVENEQANRRLKEWWESIPVIPVEIVDDAPDSPTS